MDIFSDDEPDLIGLELVREFDNLTKRFYRIFDDDFNESHEGSELCMGIRSEIVRKEVVVVMHDSYSGTGSNNDAKAKKITRRMEPSPVSTSRHHEMTNVSNIENMEQDSSEDVIVTDEKIKVVSQLPSNNRKENIKVVAHDDNSITISHLNSEGKRCIHTSVIPYNIDFESAKSTYKNGILEVTFDRQ
jgi:HSP20 family molecular chaperone IbpA